MTINEVLWILCGVALVAMTLVAMLFGSGARTRSLDDIYARRDQRLGLRTASPADAPADSATPSSVSPPSGTGSGRPSRASDPSRRPWNPGDGGERGTTCKVGSRR